MREERREEREEREEKQDGACATLVEQESVGLRSGVRGHIAEVKAPRLVGCSLLSKLFHLCNLTSNLCNRLIPVLPAWPSFPIARGRCRCVLRRRCRPPAFAWPHRLGLPWRAPAQPCSRRGYNRDFFRSAV